MKVDQQRVRDFLMEFKLIVEEGRGLDVIPRKENLELLAATGVLTEQLRRDVILGLSATDYCDGPQQTKFLGIRVEYGFLEHLLGEKRRI